MISARKEQGKVTLLLSPFRVASKGQVYMQAKQKGAYQMNGMLAHCRFTSTHLYMYTWVERGAVGVKCLAQEHNTVSPART